MTKLSTRALLAAGALLTASVGSAWAEVTPPPQDTAPAPAASATPAEPAATPPESAATPAESAAPATTPGAAPVGAPSGVATPDDAAIGQPPAGLGQVVFFRTSSMIGMPYTFHVHEGEVAYGKVNNAHYFVVNLMPGAHDFTVATEKTNHLRLEVEDGETQYVRVSMTMGVMVYRGTMSPSTAAVFQGAMHGLKRNPAHP